MICKEIHKDVQTGTDEQGQPIMTKKKFLRYLQGYNHAESTATITQHGGFKKGTYVIVYQTVF